jgi:hypothetical protein
MPSLSPIDIKLGDLLTSYPRGATVITEVVIHESVTDSREETVAVLKKRSLGVHLIVERDGSVTQHAPLTRQCAHASSPHNVRSIALEIVNPYYGHRALEGQPTINAVWAHKGVYALPTLGQVEAAWDVLGALLVEHPTIKYTFPGAPKGAFTWGRFPWLKTEPRKRPPGINAHARWDHADGLFIEHYFVCRAAGHDPVTTYAHTLLAAQSGRRRTVVPPGPKEIP